MIKKIVLITFLIMTIKLMSLEVDLRVRTQYDSNPFLLSDSDQELFDNQDAQFSYIETRDDLLTSGFLKLEQQLWKARRKTITTDLKLDFQQYMNNSEKGFLAPQLRLSYDSYRFDFAIAYEYSPHHFVRQYIDHDGTEAYEKYIYDRNSYQLDTQYRVTKRNYLIFDFAFKQEYYNEFFTEYDAEIQEYKIGWKHSFKQYYLTGMYEYIDYKNDVPTISEALQAGYGRDASYESNVFSLSLRYKKIKLSKGKSFRPSFRGSIEQRYYQTEFDTLIDPIHSGREDNITNLGISCDFYFFKFFDISLDYKHTYRKVDATYKDLSETKEYTRDKVGLEFTYHWKWKK